MATATSRWCDPCPYLRNSAAGAVVMVVNQCFSGICVIRLLVQMLSDIVMLEMNEGDWKVLVVLQFCYSRLPRHSLTFP